MIQQPMVAVSTTQASTRTGDLNPPGSDHWERPNGYAAPSLEPLGRRPLGRHIVGRRLVHRELDLAQDALQVSRGGPPLGLPLRIRLTSLTGPGRHQRGGVMFELVELRPQCAERLVDVDAGLLQGAEVDEQNSVVHKNPPGDGQSGRVKVPPVRATRLAASESVA